MEPLDDAATVAGAVGIFAILKAFSLGATALTGVEAISNGVPAFRPPQSRNAASTLAVMAALAITMFLGISWLSTHIGGVIASEHRSVVARIAIAVFGDRSAGFFVVQTFTALILDPGGEHGLSGLPSSRIDPGARPLHAEPVREQGDRLVFSNGVIVLASLSCLMIYAFDAELSTLINFYVVGVFTSFTLSQSGMIRHWLKEGRKGASAIREWRRSIVINTIGAVTTFVVLIVVIISKTPDGAWLSIVIMAVLVPVFVSIHRHYAGVASELARERPEAERMSNTHLILLVPDLDASTAVALGYVRGIHQPGGDRGVSGRRWHSPQRSLGSMAAVRRSGLPLEVVTGTSLADVVKRRIASLDRSSNDLVTIVIPERISGGLATYLLRRRSFLHLKLRLLRERNVVVTDVPVHLGNGELRGVDGRALIPHRIVTLAFVSSVNAASIRAVRYAMSLGSAETDRSTSSWIPREVSASRTTGSTPGCPFRSTSSRLRSGT